MDKPQLRPDQIAELAFYMSQLKCMDLSEPGTGKTPPVCVNFERRAAEGIRSIWVQPKSLIDKNVDEITTFTNIPRDQIAVIDGTPAKIAKELAKNPTVMLMGPDRFARMWAEGIDSNFKGLDVDEYHLCFKGAKAARTGAYLDAMARQMTEGVAMSGTMVNGRLDSAWSAVHAIEPRYYPLGIDQFLYIHATLDEYDRPIADGWKNHARLGEIFGRHGIRKLFKDIFGEQVVVWQPEWVDMAPRQKEMYKKFEKEAMLELEKFIVDGTVPGVATARARQIMECPNFFPDLTDPDGKRTVDICPGELPGKEQRLEIHIEDHLRKGTPMLIGSAIIKQHAQIATLCERLGFRVGMINGEVSRTERARVDRAYRAGELDGVIGSPATCSVGYNWQFWGPNQVETDHVLLMSLGYMDSDTVQFYRRAVRQARKNPLRVTTMTYYDSLDPRIMDIQERKSIDANLVDPTREILNFRGQVAAEPREEDPFAFMSM